MEGVGGHGCEYMTGGVVVLPIDTDPHGAITVRTSAELRSDGHRRMADWMSKVEKVWKEKRKKYTIKLLM